MLIVVAIIIVGKSAAAFGIVLALGRSLRTALTVAASLSQIGELSFILAGLGMALGILPAEGRNLVLAGALVSITLNPLMLGLADRVQGAARHSGGASNHGLKPTACPR